MFSAMVRKSVSLRWSEDNLFESVFYKHFVPAGRGAVQNVGRRHKSHQNNKKLMVCITAMGGFRKAKIFDSLIGFAQKVDQTC